MLVPVMRERLLAALSGTVDVLDGLLGQTSPEDVLWDLRPDPDRFTLREVLAHLADYEEVWRERVRQTREEAGAELFPADKDRLAVEHDYAHSDVVSTRAAFRQRRAALVEYLRDLVPEDWQKVSYLGSPNSSPLTLEEQAAFVVIHDAYHTQQVAVWVRNAHKVQKTEYTF